MTEKTENEAEETELKILQLRRSRAVRESKLLEVEFTEDHLPIVYHPNYNISLLGLEKLHPFDAKKWGNVVRYLIDAEVLTNSQLIQPVETSFSDLRVVHTKSYLASLQCPAFVAKCVEVPWAAFVPCCIINRKFLKPMRLQTGGTVLATKLALERGWAINIGGGFHHAHSFNGGGFCVYADISLAIRFMQLSGSVEKVMIIDLDAHQGNGHERDFLSDDTVYIMDMFNYEIYPRDFKAKEGINLAVRLESQTQDVPYLSQLKHSLKKAFEEFKPDLVVYNAGTDCLDGDTVGHLGLSEKAIIRRDEMVFKKCKEVEVPIVMLLSGGYTSRSAKVIADSITNLVKEEIIG